MTSSGAETRDVGPRGDHLPLQASSAQPAHAEWSSSHVLGGAHVRSTFKLSTCRRASLCTWVTGPVHGPIGWACLLVRQPFVRELTSKSVPQPRMRLHSKAAQPRRLVCRPF